jgi:hypothetical protein
MIVAAEFKFFVSAACGSCNKIIRGDIWPRYCTEIHNKFPVVIKLLYDEDKNCMFSEGHQKGGGGGHFT